MRKNSTEKHSILTVTGEISSNEVGICDAHTHVWIDPVAGAAENAPTLNDQPAILKELYEYHSSGGDALVDCQPGGCGRNGTRLLELSQKSGVKIIACSGFHRIRYYPADYWMWKASVEQITNYMVGEIREGLVETKASVKPVRAGFIKVACEAQLSQTPRSMLEAAADAANETGSAIQVHTEKGADVEKIITYLNHCKIPPGKIVLCHMDKRPDFTLHCELARSGILLEYDTFHRPKYDPEHNLWPLIEKMALEGYCDHVALATDMAEPALWRYQGGSPGLSDFPVNIRARLQEMGLEDKSIDQLTGKNIARRLARPTGK